MLRPIEGARTIIAGSNDPIIRMKGCPDCGGYGWLIENPFAQYNKKYIQCPTCLDAKRHHDEHGTIPADIAAAIVDQGAAK
jgi:hypothetical protein